MQTYFTDHMNYDFDDFKVFQRFLGLSVKSYLPPLPWQPHFKLGYISSVHVTMIHICKY